MIHRKPIINTNIYWTASKQNKNKDNSFVSLMEWHCYVDKVFAPYRIYKRYTPTYRNRDIHDNVEKKNLQLFDGLLYVNRIMVDGLVKEMNKEDRIYLNNILNFLHMK